MILAGPDSFFRPCSRHRVRPSYGDFRDSFAMKARAGPYGSYDNSSYQHFHVTIVTVVIFLFLISNGPFTSYNNVLICNTSNVMTSEVLIESYYFLEAILTVILCTYHFILLQMNLIELPQIRTNDTMISNLDSCDCVRTGRSPVY